MINDTDTDTDDSEIDNEWVDEFKKKEEIYDDFYKEKVEHIKLFYIYRGRCPLAPVYLP